MEDTLQITGLESLISPEPIGFWPPAPGWYVLAGMIFAGLLYGIYRWWRYRRINRYRRYALDQLTGLRYTGQNEPDPGDIHKLNHLLKRTVLETYPREQVAALTGSAWVDFLKGTLPNTGFSETQERLLAAAGYQNPEQIRLSQEDWNELLGICGRWIRNHKRGSLSSVT